MLKHILIAILALPVFLLAGSPAAHALRHFVEVCLSYPGPVGIDPNAASLILRQARTFAAARQSKLV